MVDSGATNSFVHSEVIHLLNTITVDTPAMRVTLADNSYVNCSTALPLYLKLCGYLQQSLSGVSEPVNVGCSVFVLFCPI